VRGVRRDAGDERLAVTTIDESYDTAAVNCGRRFGERCGAAYDLLGRLEPGLCVDVGAALGRTTWRMLHVSPGSTVTAYEPFVGNHRYFNDLIGDDARVTLRPVAVSDRAGQASFLVPKVVGPGEAGWAKDLQGYSPLGHLGGNRGLRLAVETVTLDEEIGQPVRCLKIDVQGGELGVLRGAARLIDSLGVDVIHLEFNGALPVLEFLQAHGYVLFDCAYMAWPTRRYYRNWTRRRPDRLVPAWRIVEQGTKSMGSRVVYGWPPSRPGAFGAYCAWFFVHRLLFSGLQTDLLCVREDFLPTVWHAQQQVAAG
jgi:FkbM family methyltransferase